MRTYFFLFLLLALPICAGAQFFTKVVTGPLTNTPGDSRSVNWVDVNNDGFVDCMITNGPSGGQNNSLFLNDTKGGFTALTSDTIVKDKKPSDGATWADLDNDGDLDCFVVNWYNVNNMLYLNDKAKFEQVKVGSLVLDAGYSETASWGDYDSDGFVDLYVTNSAGNKRNFLYHNNGDRTFTKVTKGPMVTDAFDSRSVNWVDIDQDGDLDLFVTNESNQNENLYRNDGMGNFTKLEMGPLVNAGGNSISGSWGDYDNDGDLDVFVCNDGSSNALFRNNGAFDFSVVPDTVSKTNDHSFSSAWSDIDNDGDLDLFVTNAFFSATKLRNFLYLNNGNGTFSRNSTDLVTRDSAWSYGCAFGDYDNDGFQDLAVATTRFAGLDEPDFLYHNQGNTNNWITIKLLGTKSNKAAIGAKVRVKAMIGGKAVWQLREISAQNGYCSQNDIRAHFGLKDAASIDSLLIEWPSGLKEYYLNVPAKKFVTYQEGDAKVSIVPIRERLLKIDIYPNPTRTEITVEKVLGDFAASDHISLLALSGQVLQEWPACDCPVLKLQLDRVKNSSGPYLLRIESELQRFTQKIIME